MKICSKCQTVYDDDSMLFCIKDGSPLNTFTQTESNDIDDDDEKTQVTAPPSSPTPPPNRERIVIPLNKPESTISRNIPPQSTNQKPMPQKKTSVALAVILAILGTLGVVALGVGGLYVWQNRTSEPIAQNNSNITNTNANSNLLTNVNSGGLIFNTNVNSNSLLNSNLNLNLNVNRTTPTPTPKPSPKPSITPTPKPSPTFDGNANVNSNANNLLNLNANRPANSNSTPQRSPTPNANEKSVPPVIGGGIVNGKATRLVTPAYPPAARAVRASGQVSVQVLIDEQGNVVSANAVSGNPLLRSAAANAAKQSKFAPTLLSNQPVKVSGTIIYNFVSQQ